MRENKDHVLFLKIDIIFSIERRETAQSAIYEEN